MNDVLRIEYETGDTDGIVLLTVKRNGQDIWVFHDEQARSIYKLLTGDDTAVKIAREGLLKKQEN